MRSRRKDYCAAQPRLELSSCQLNKYLGSIQYFFRLLISFFLLTDNYEINTDYFKWKLGREIRSEYTPNDEDDESIQDQAQDLSMHNRRSKDSAYHSPSSEESDATAKPLSPYMPAAQHQIRVSTSMICLYSRSLFSRCAIFCHICYR